MIPELDERLSAAASFFPACDIGADIGADHGRLSCYLLANDIVRRMIVSDVSADSLMKARQLLTKHALTDRAQFVVADGLNALSEHVDAIAILGMGGATAVKILNAHPEKLAGARLVMSAHTDIPLLRNTLCHLHYRIENEMVVCAKERFYVVLRAAPGDKILTPREAFLGPVLSQIPGDGIYAKYLARRLSAFSVMRGEQARLETRWLKEELERVTSDCPDNI